MATTPKPKTPTTNEPTPVGAATPRALPAEPPTAPETPEPGPSGQSKEPPVGAATPRARPADVPTAVETPKPTPVGAATPRALPASSTAPDEERSPGLQPDPMPAAVPPTAQALPSVGTKVMYRTGNHSALPGEYRPAFITRTINTGEFAELCVLCSRHDEHGPTLTVAAKHGPNDGEWLTEGEYAQL